jgi:anaerobic magnesium-protoporphyrin IX monomethyl ester cyclase
MGPLLLSSVLRENGHDPYIFDINGFRYSDQYVTDWISKADFDLYGVTGLVTQWNYMRWVCDEIKRCHPKAKVVAGGSAVSNSPELFSKRVKSVDAIAVGEGERVILDVVRDAEKGELVGSDKCVLDTQRALDEPIHVDGGRDRPYMFERTEYRPTKPVYQADLIKDLDTIPIPDYEHLDSLDIYLKNPVGYRNKRKWIDGRDCDELTNLCILSTRSCVFSCSFCAFSYLGRAARTMNAGRVVDIIEHIHDRFQVDYVHFLDEITFFSKIIALKFCDEMIRRGMNEAVKWGAPCRIDVLDKETVDAMVEAGCLHIGCGIESLSAKVLKTMDKYQQLQGGVQRVVENLRYARKKIPDVDTSFIIGYPGETRETIGETVQNMRLVGDDFKPSCVFYATPYPRTGLWEIATKAGVIGTSEDAQVRHIESLGENMAQMVINFTDIPLSELRVWKRRMELAKFDVSDRDVAEMDERDKVMVYEGVHYSYPT